MKVKGYFGEIIEYTPMTINELKTIPRKMKRLNDLKNLYNNTDYSTVKAVNYDSIGSQTHKHDQLEIAAINISEARNNVLREIYELSIYLCKAINNATDIIGFITPISESQADFLMQRFIECNSIDHIMDSMDQTDKSAFYKLQKRSLESFENIQIEHKKLYPE